MARSTRTSRELLEISPGGALAGRAFALILVGSAIALVTLSWDELWRRCGAIEGRCVERAAGAGLVTILAVFGLLAGVVIWRRVGQRPVDPDGSSRYVWALGVVFALGLLLVSAQIPAFTCERGRFDEPLRLCMHPPSTSEPASWVLAKRAIAVAGLIGGVAIAATPRLVRAWVPAALIAWLAGVGWVLLDAWA